MACVHATLIALFRFEKSPNRAVPLRVAQSLFFDTLLSLPNMFDTGWSLPSLATRFAGMKWFSQQLDISEVNHISISDLRRLGYAKNDEAATTGILILAGQCIAWPGATWAAVWHCQEAKIASACV